MNANRMWEERYKVGDGGGSKIMWKIMRVISKVDGQGLNVSAIKRGPQGWCGSWPRLFVIHMAGWLMGPPKLQKTAFAVVQ